MNSYLNIIYTFNKKFTTEKEENGCIPFLDLMLRRDEHMRIKFGIYRKETAMNRFITNESHHHESQKYAAFNSMIFRPVNIPLEKEEYLKEFNHIINTALINGFTETMVNSLLKKQKRNKLLKETTTLKPFLDVPKHFAINYHVSAFPKLHKCFTDANIKLIPKSTTKIKNLLQSTKDPIANNEKPGIYYAHCDNTDCDLVYIGQTARELKIRAKEHIRYIKNKEAYRSGLAEHSLQFKHNVKMENFVLKEHESNPKRLDVLESIHIHLNKEKTMNRDEGKCISKLFNLLM